MEEEEEAEEEPRKAWPRIALPSASFKHGTAARRRARRDLPIGRPTDLVRLAFIFRLACVKKASEVQGSLPSFGSGEYANAAAAAAAAAFNSLLLLLLRLDSETKAGRGAADGRTDGRTTALLLLQSIRAMHCRRRLSVESCRASNARNNDLLGRILHLEAAPVSLHPLQL